MSFKIHSSTSKSFNEDSSLSGTELITTNSISVNVLISIIDNLVEEKTVNLPTEVKEGTSKIVQLKHISGFDCIVQNKDGAVQLSGDYPTREFRYINGKWVTNVNSLYSYFPSRQQTKIVPTNNIGIPNFGSSVSISKDGNTIVVGGSSDNTIGSVWIYIKSIDGIWTFIQKLSVTDFTVGNVFFGDYVSISGDGNVIAVGGRFNDSSNGAVWIFSKIVDRWYQQTKLTGIDSLLFGSSISLNYSGNVLAVGAPMDSLIVNIGSTYIYNRFGNVWTQTTKIVSTDRFDNNSRQGTSVSLSSNGKTLAIGGSLENGSRGSTWIYTEIDGNWSQQGSKLDITGQYKQGFSVSLSSNGNILAIGGVNASLRGNVWIFNRSGEIWTQMINILPKQNNILSTTGSNAKLSSNGKTLVLVFEKNPQREIWIYTQSEEIWTLQKTLLVNNPIGNTKINSIDINDDGSIIVLGGKIDNASIGAVWIFN
jgi:hypothetical protein